MGSLISENSYPSLIGFQNAWTKRVKLVNEKQSRELRYIPEGKIWNRNYGYVIAA